ncbi:hypothetical protein VaNZ11_000762 [Volvox africanus]|uniref:Spc7 kinetochore protein domain-containing protein n=1 Tax=Volvox africanus TaxID=51714 RepID=A0ABQ5RP46_9CHLO|nr:hypothetical protein VaNZ11_000762 [Volvox africanus]
MQPSMRTPNSILRKRANKENEDATGKLNKRNKLAKRRVSFAPDDELETKHIFKEDSDRNSTGDPASTRGLGPAQAKIAVAAPEDQANRQFMGDTLAVLPSPNNLSPVSMDLTNNSIDQLCAGTMTAAPGPGPIKGSAVEGAAASLSLPPPLQQPFQSLHPQHARYTRMNMTINVPNLSTLVEEDEEHYGAGDVSSRLGKDADATTTLRQEVLSGVASGFLPSESPMSPNSVREMQMCRDSEHQAEQEEGPLRDIWGFAPGKDDTLEVNCCREVMGERTYNHVYGTGTINEVTYAINDGRTSGLTSNQPAANARLTGAGLAPAPRGPRKPVHAGPEAPTTDAATAEAAVGAARGAATAAAAITGTIQAAAAEAAPAAAGMADAAVQLPMRHAPLRPQQTELSVIQTQALQTRSPVHNTPVLDTTTQILEGDQTEAWRLPDRPGAYDRGRLSVASNRVLAPGYRRGAGAGETTVLLGPTMTLASTGNGGNLNLVQMLAETPHPRAAYERLIQNMQGAQASPVAVPPTRTGAGTRPQGAIAAPSIAMRQRSATSYNDQNLSLELKMAGGGDLFEEGGLSLDLFQMPPEPTTAFPQPQAEDHQQQQQQQQRLVQVGGDEVVPGMRFARGVGASERVPPATVRSQPPRLSCQEFLGLIDVSFINKICRETFQPGFDPPPRTVLEIFEAATCTTAFVEAYHTRSMDFATRLAGIAASMSKMEAKLTANKQGLFAEVQRLPSNELEVVKEKFANLKELCRLQMVKQIKQNQVSAMRDHMEKLASRKLQLQGDLEAATADMERLQECAKEIDTLPTLIARMQQEDEDRVQEALERQRKLESYMQRLQALRTQNEERQRRLDAAQAEHHAKIQSRPSFSSLMDERRELEERAANLRARLLNTNVMTPARDGHLIRQATKKFATAEAILGLHGLRLDYCPNAADTRALRLLFRRAYAIVCNVSHSEGSTDVRVVCEDATAAGFDALAPSIQDCIRASSSELSCTIPRTQLPLRLEFILEHLQRLCRIARQLESCWMRFSCMQRPCVKVPVLQQDFDEPALVLRFTNADTITGVTIRMAWSEALHSDYVKPRLKVELTSLDPPETQQQYCDALLDTVLSKLPAGRDYIETVCYAMSETLQVAAEGA